MRRKSLVLSNVFLFGRCSFLSNAPAHFYEIFLGLCYGEMLVAIGQLTGTSQNRIDASFSPVFPGAPERVEQGEEQPHPRQAKIVRRIIV